MSEQEFLDLPTGLELVDILNSLMIIIEENNCGVHGTDPTHKVSIVFKNEETIPDLIYLRNDKVHYVSNGKKLEIKVA